jgi:two-component system phosphate regulon sensor histidine kinase PhoR
MTKRIFHSILAVSLAVLLSCLVLIVGVLHGYFETRVEAELKAQTAYIAQGVEHEGTGYFLRLNSQSRITWVDADGKVLYDSVENASKMENHADRQEIREALKTGEGRSVRFSKTLSQKTVYYALRLTDGTVLRASDTQYSVWAVVAQVLQPVAIIVLIACVLAAVMASRAAKQIVEPINALDLTDPGGNDECYDELAPLLTRIRSQNRQIARQMQDLRSRQEEFSAITENMDEGFLVLDLKSRVLSYNSAALRLLNAENVPVAEDTVAFALSRQPDFRRAVEESLAGRRSEQMMETESSCLQVIANPVFQDSHLNGVVLVILDVTEKEQREQLRREFTANVSHELKTPLTSISGTAEILENGFVKPEDIPHFAGNIRKEAGRLINLVNDIIRLSRLDEGGFTAEWRECNLYETADSVLEQLRAAAEERQISLNLTGESTRVRAVPQILEEILYNLCDNAVKYNRAGGSVNVSVHGTEVTVEDTGVGIPPELRERVFERFYRVDKSHAERGTGLGLSIVKHGAAYLGASVALKSEVGKGSRFTLTFPAQNLESESV